MLRVSPRRGMIAGMSDTKSPEQEDLAPAMASRRPTILVVDDVPLNLMLLRTMLCTQYNVLEAGSGEQGLDAAMSANPPDLILLDVMMPGMDGYEVCRRLKADLVTRDIPVIFLTAKSEESDEEHGLALGAVDYLSKPIRPHILLARVRTQLTLKASADFLRDKNAFLEAEVGKRTRELTIIQDATILAITSLAHTSEGDSGQHIRRLQRYVKALAWKLSTHPRFSQELTTENIGLLFKSVPLHDIGKVTIPDCILLKPGELTAAEQEILQTHPTVGRNAIARAEEELGERVAFLSMAKDMAYSHQEKWDGSGYPQGLGGEQIPISARLVALAHVYDAVISKRVYKDPIPHPLAVEIIAKGSECEFDPDIVEAFLSIQDTFHAIAISYCDSEADITTRNAYLTLAKVTG